MKKHLRECPLMTSDFRIGRRGPNWPNWTISLIIVGHGRKGGWKSWKIVINYGRSLGYNKNSERKDISDCSGVLWLNWKRSQHYRHLLLNGRTTYFSYDLRFHEFSYGCSQKLPVKPQWVEKFKIRLRSKKNVLNFFCNVISDFLDLLGPKVRKIQNAVTKQFQ